MQRRRRHGRGDECDTEHPGPEFAGEQELIGAGDGTYLAWAGLAVLVVFAPAVLVVAAAVGGLLAVWVVFSAVFMGARAVVLLARARGDAWLVLGDRLGSPT